ncbi:peptidylprolyl isomerase [Oceanispirochaeta crateris]|uniref:peptidylprolyl isomerase n=1 Tax=Oceanispirochaeta crateris TaxID=2518645 RepID=A0A5C1QM26_9SPIO|nr:peptidylprolyl isomerase [Oceanispirochaeta crateris]QEN09123.1 peptidylprolyl isomerase [Oceanispirochaeta crateris]
MKRQPTLKTVLLAGVLLMTTTMSAVAVDKSSLKDGLYALIDTNRGEILVNLEFEKTPLTVINFTGLAEGKIDANKKGNYYDGIKFHRVIDDFMIQGGDPTGTGSGGPGYNFPDEIDNSLQFDGPGILAMANAGPGTNGSQFFITHVETSWLQGKHTIFGKVLEGQDVVNAIKANDKINTIEVIRVGAKAEAFENDQKAFDAALEKLAGAEMRKKAEAQKSILEEINKKWPDAQVSKSGIRYIIEKEGSGSKPTTGTNVKVHYTGMFLDGRKFDSSVDRGTPFEFPAGGGRVIAGWDETILDMKKGEKRTIILPPELAYGSRGAGGVIPPDAWLLFEVELLDF